MKTWLLLMLFAALGLTGAAQVDVNITIDGNTTLEQMQNHKIFLMDNGYLFNISKMKFSNSGKLNELAFRVITPGGTQGTAAALFDDKGKKLKIVHKADNSGFCVGDCQ